MHNEDVVEKPQDARKMHTVTSVIFLICIVVCSFLLGAGVGSKLETNVPSDVIVVEKTEQADTLATNTKETSKAAAKEKQEILLSTKEMPTYEIELLEEPEITMWQFTHAVTERDAALVGRGISSLDDERTNYEIVIMKEPSLISDEYNYYLCIKGYWEEEYLCFKVTEVIIDDVWNTLVMHISDWNALTEEENFRPANYNKFQALTSYLKSVSEDYIVRDIPAKYFVVKGELLTPNV